VLVVYGPKAVTVCVTLYRSGKNEGLVHVEEFSEPFKVEELPFVGPEIVAKVQQVLTREPRQTQTPPEVIGRSQSNGNVG